MARAWALVNHASGSLVLLHGDPGIVVKVAANALESKNAGQLDANSGDFISVVLDMRQVLS